MRSGSRIPEPGDAIRIRYLRPPDREQLFVQRLVARTPEGIVTLLDRAELTRPSVVDGVTILEPGSPIVWFSFAGAHHDIGRFHLADGTHTGLYANILTPVDGLSGSDWSTTDLFLDVWLDAAGAPARLLDEEELADAAARGWVDASTARSAAAEAARLMAGAGAGTWPPPIVREWTLERAYAALRHNGARSV